MYYIVKLKKITEASVVIKAKSDEEADELLQNGKYEFISDNVVTRDDYIGYEYVSHVKTDTVIKSESDLREYYGIKNIEKLVYDNTECGCCYRSTKDYVAVNGYAEGSGDAECKEHILYFPFTIEEWSNAIKEADDEGCELWHEYNDEEE